MKQTKNDSAKLNFYGRKAILIGLILGLTAVWLITKPFMQPQSAQTNSSAKAAPTPPDDPLDKEALQELIEKLTVSLAEAIEDEDKQKSILEKWEERMDELRGKTEKQVIEILFEDVKSVVKDKEVTDKLWEEWNSDDDYDYKAEGATVLSAERKRELGLKDESDFKAKIAGASFKTETGNYKGQTYTIYSVDNDPELKEKVAGVHKGVSILINYGFNLPKNLSFYFTVNPPKAIAFKRNANWERMAKVVLGKDVTVGGSPATVSIQKIDGLDKVTVTVIHEVGHLIHEEFMGDSFWIFDPPKKDLKPGERYTQTADRVSEYAMGNRREFVSEVFAGTLAGKKYCEEVMAEYKKWGGPMLKVAGSGKKCQPADLVVK